MSKGESTAAETVRGPILATAVVAGVFTLGGLAFFGARIGLSVAVGGVAAVGNLMVLSGLVRALTTPSADATADATADADASADADADASADADAAPSPAESRASAKRGGAAWAALGFFKILVLFGGLWLLLTRGWVDPIGLVVGYGALPIGISVSAIGRSLRP